MFFIVSKLAWTFLQPGTVFLFILLAGVILSRTRQARIGRALIYTATAIFLAVAVLPIGEWAMAPLEDRFPQPASLPDTVDGIIVIGGGVNPAMTEDRGLPALTEFSGRMTNFIGLARRYPDAKLVFTGGSGAIDPGPLNEADVARKLFDQLDFDSRRVTFEARSRNTWENGLLTQRLVQPGPGETWLVVTSAFHMPRVMGVFDRLGWRVIPYPVDYRTLRHGGSLDEISLARELRLVDLATHEWVGLLAYRLVGHSDRLFPAP